MSEHIVAVLVDAQGVEMALQAAYEASLAFEGAKVTAFHVFVDPESTILPTEEMMTDVRRQELERFEEGNEKSVHAIYARVAGQLDPNRFAWTHVFGREKVQVADLTATARLIVMPRPASHASGFVREAFHAALYDTHCPLLIVPPCYVCRPVQRIVIGWSDDDTCMRAVQAAEPWLRQAQDIDVVHVGVVQPDRADAIRRSLKVSAARVSVRELDPDDVTEGEQILAAAAGADWLVMGGYHHAHWLEWIGGGVTETVLHKATVPAFVVH